MPRCRRIRFPHKPGARQPAGRRDRIELAGGVVIETNAELFCMCCRKGLFLRQSSGCPLPHFDEQFAVAIGAGFFDDL
jgi:hypothetical protein